MRKIIFVDDEPGVLSGFKRALRTMRQEWDVEFVMSGEDALNLMSRSSFDVIVSDMRMPEMNGVELLNTVMERHPEIVRVILSGHSDKELILNSLKCTHQFLTKPCSPETIKYTIKRACKLQDLLRDKMLKKIVSGIKELPSLPGLYSQMVEEIQSPDASIKKVGYIISQDISMSARILQVVNSAYFGLPQKITDTQQATIYLGMETMKALVLSIHVFSSFEEEAVLCGVSLSEIQEHSLMVCKLAKWIARVEKAEKEVVEQAVVAGMLHDIGKLIMLKVPEQYRQVEHLVETTGCGVIEAEYNVLKTSHAELGAYLLGIWGFPDSIVEAVAFHHNPLKLSESMFAMENQSQNGDADKTKPDNGGLNSQSIKEHLTEFNLLTSVHVANALMMQKDCPSNVADFIYFDMGYLKALELTDKLPEWVEYYNKVTQEEV